MKTTEILMDEHKVILSKLEDLECLLKKDESSIECELDYYFDFIKEYSDDYHHAKEEDIYFKWMIERNPQVEFGPIARMLTEHDMFRTYVGNAKKSLAEYRLSKENNSLDDCRKNLQIFIVELRMHISKEDNILYQIAENINAHEQDGDENMLERFIDIQNKYKDKIQKYI